MHGMAYYIFLKSLRSLEEFSKNPHNKISPKSPPTNFQSLCIFKNPISYSKRIFPPNSGHSASRPAHSPDLGLPAGTSHPIHLPGPPAQRPPLLSLTTGSRSPSSSSGLAGLRLIPVVPQPHPSRHGRPPPMQDPPPSTIKSKLYGT
jgi:hypothetical protein